MVKKAKSTSAGLILIFCGIYSMVSGVSLPITNWLPTDTSTSLIITVLLIAFGVIALAGGVCSVRHKWWALASIGSICAIFVTFLLSRYSSHLPGLLMILPQAVRFLAIASVLLLAFSRNDFKKSNVSEGQ